MKDFGRDLTPVTKNKKQKKMSEEQRLGEDMLVWRRYVERDIQKAGSAIRNEIGPSTTTKEKQGISVSRALQIILLGFFGPCVLVLGLYLLVKGNGVVGVLAVIIGIVFVIALILNEKYR